MNISTLNKNFVILMILLFTGWSCPILAFDDVDSEDDIAGEFAEDTSEFADNEDKGDNKSSVGLQFSGMLEMEQGRHVGEQGAQERDWVTEYKRLRLKTAGESDVGKYYLKLDFVDDGVTDKQNVEIREARFLFSPLESIDISVGTQVSTWGVSDMLYINDLFPKNWVANFQGRDMETLKEPSSSLRVTLYFGISSGIDMVYHPEFSPDITPTGCRFSIYDPNTNTLVSNADSCDDDFNSSQQIDEYSHGEFATRWFHKIASHEFAFYTYTGYFKNPKGQQWVDSSGKATGNTNYAQEEGYKTVMSYYPKLNVYGFSAEGQLGPGIYSFENGYYDSREDQDGKNPYIKNSFWKNLVGYKIDINAAFSIGVQWYSEIMDNYDEYEDSLVDMLIYKGSMSESGAKKQGTYKYRDKKTENTYTLRLTYKTMQERLWFNFFGYNRPEDHDGFYKFDVSYQMDNNFHIITGINIFEGDENYISREYAMLKDDDNAFVRLRYIF